MYASSRLSRPTYIRHLALSVACLSLAAACGTVDTTTPATQDEAARASSDLLKALRLTDPRAVTEPSAHLDRDIPRRALYARMWEEVKASG